MTLSKLHSRCDKCKEKDTCDEKRMVACGIAELPPKARADMKSPISETMAREYTPITIYKGENCTINTSLEEIKRQIEEDFYKNIRCGLNKTL